MTSQGGDPISSDLRLAVVVGNPRPHSRTRGVAERLATSLAPTLPATWSPDMTIDLATIAESLVSGGADAVAAATAVGAADVLVVATPVYKASFTGLLKLFLDRLPGGALAGSVAVPVSVSAAPTHRLLADLHLRPVLAELGASLPVTSFFVEEPELPDVAALAGQWVAAHAPVVRACAVALR